MNFLLLLLSPLLVLLSLGALAAADLAWSLFGRRRPPEDSPARHDAASVVIPNWNGQELLDKYLPSVEAALEGNPENEIIVVDNASTDNSVELLRERFPKVRVLPLDRNLGFGGGSNAGFREARNDVVVLLNSDMRVEPDFLEPLLLAFEDPKVFSVACQIFFRDPSKRREETGLTQFWWEDGALRVTHREDPAVSRLYPCAYGGGGSSAFDRRKFLDLGGFDPLLAPFYLEDTDLGFRAWKRGWKCLYEPRSRVFHEHRGTIGRHYSEDRIQAALKKNYLLFAWKNVHEWRRLASHFFFAWSGAVWALVAGEAPARTNLLALWRAFLSLPEALSSRWRARGMAMISDTETFRRPMGGYYRDRFNSPDTPPERLRVVFVSPYAICPPVHGGGVFMYQTLRELAKLCEVHVVCVLDHPSQMEENLELREFCASAEFIARERSWQHRGRLSLAPHAVREFASPDLEWLIHRQLYLNRADVLQLEYTVLGQYGGDFECMATALFEHDVYFQSLARAIGYMPGWLSRRKAGIEYLRALRFELRTLPGFDRVQVCTTENREYLAGYLPESRERIESGLRAGIRTSRYCFRLDGREPDTMLFIGNFRHTPNKIAVEWFLARVLPLVLDGRPSARLVVAGSDPPLRHTGVEWLGVVEDVRAELARRAVFVCPILNGSGVRVKLLEAFASGIPVVSTTVGAEGLARNDGEFCALADEPGDFARAILDLFRDPGKGKAMAARARAEVEAHWDMPVITRRLEASYQAALAEKRGTTCRRDPSLVC